MGVAPQPRTEGGLGMSVLGMSVPVWAQIDGCLGVVLSFCDPPRVSLLHTVSTELATLGRTAAGRCFWRWACIVQHRSRDEEWKEADQGSCWFQTWRTNYAAQYMRSHRDAVLRGALAQRGLQFRQDSWQCANYVHGVQDAMRLGQLVDLMEEFAFLHNMTDYPQVCAAALPIDQHLIDQLADRFET